MVRTRCFHCRGRIRSLVGELSPTSRAARPKKKKSKKACYHTDDGQHFVQSAVQSPEVWGPIRMAEAPLEREESGKDLRQLVLLKRD